MKSFVEYLFRGLIYLYLRQQKAEVLYYIDKEGMSFTEIPTKETLSRENGKMYLITSTKHMGVLMVYMQDAPQMTQKKPIQEFPFYELPAYLGYIYKDKRVQPKVGVGFNMRSTLLIEEYDYKVEGFHQFSYSCGGFAGVDVRVIGNLFIGAKFEFDCTLSKRDLYSSYDMFDILSYSYGIGLRYDFNE